MSLLEKLIEKKDLDVYCKLRIRRLKDDIIVQMDSLPEKKRECIKRQLEGRIKELQRLRGKLKNTTHIKDECKGLWKHYGLMKKRGDKK